MGFLGLPNVHQSDVDFANLTLEANAALESRDFALYHQLEEHHSTFPTSMLESVLIGLRELFIEDSLVVKYNNGTNSLYHHADDETACGLLYRRAAPGNRAAGQSHRGAVPQRRQLSTWYEIARLR